MTKTILLALKSDTTATVSALLVIMSKARIIASHLAKVSTKDSNKIYFIGTQFYYRQNSSDSFNQRVFNTIK